jgi:helicase MOV-10
MVKICARLEAQGACTDPLCREYHQVHICELCSVFCASTKWYEAHLAGKNHRRRLRGFDGRQYHCTICDTQVSGQRFWVQHVKGMQHCRNAEIKGALANVAPIIPDTLPGKSFCGVCDKYVPNSLWASHPQSSDHRKKEGYAAFKIALEEAEKDRHGVVLSEGLDFGIVESEDAARGVSRTLTIEITVPSSRVIIKSVSFSSSFTGTQSP